MTWPSPDGQKVKLRSRRPLWVYHGRSKKQIERKSEMREKSFRLSIESDQSAVLSSKLTSRQSGARPWGNLPQQVPAPEWQGKVCAQFTDFWVFIYPEGGSLMFGYTASIWTRFGCHRN